MGKCASRDKSASSSRTPRFLFKKGAEKHPQPAVNPDQPKPSSGKEEEEKKVVETSEAATGPVPAIESKPGAEPVIPGPPPPVASPPPPPASSPPPPPPPPPASPPAPSDDADIDTTVTTFDEQYTSNAYSGRITLLPGDESSSASSSAYNTANPSPARSFRSPDSAVYLSGSEDMPSYRASPAHPVPNFIQASGTDEDPFLARAGVRKQAAAGSSSTGFSGQRSGDDGAAKEPEVRSASPLQGEENWEMVSPKGLGPGEWVSVAKPEGQGSKELAAAPPVMDEGTPKVVPVAAAAAAATWSKSKTSSEDEEADTVKSLGSDQSDEIETRSLTGDGGDYVLLGATEKGEKADNTAVAPASEPTSSVAAGAITEVDPDSKSATPSDSQVVAKPAEAAPASSVESQAPIVEQRSLPVESAPVETAAPVVEAPGTQIEEKAKLPVEEEEKASSAPSVEEVPTPIEKAKDDAPAVAAPAEDLHTPAMNELAAAKDEAHDSPVPEDSTKASVAEEEKAAPVIVEEVNPAPIVEEVDLAPIVEEVNPAPIVDEVDPAPIVEEVDPAPIVEEVNPAPIVEKVDPAPIVEELEATPAPVVEDDVAAEESTPETGKVPLLASKTAPEPASEPAPEPASEPAPEPASETALEPASAPEPASETASEPVSAPEPASETALEPASAPEPVSKPVSGPASETVPGPAPEAPVVETKSSSDDNSWRTFKEEIQSKSGTTAPSEAAPTA